MLSSHLHFLRHKHRSREVDANFEIKGVLGITKTNLKKGVVFLKIYL